MVVRLSTIPGSSGSIGRICAGLVKAKWFQASWTLKVEYVSGWGSVGGGQLCIQDQGGSRDSGVLAELESDVTVVKHTADKSPSCDT